MSDYCSKCGVKFVGGVCPNCYGTKEEQELLNDNGYEPSEKAAPRPDTGRTALIAVLSVIAVMLTLLVILSAYNSFGGRNGGVTQNGGEPSSEDSYSSEEADSDYDDGDYQTAETTTERQKQLDLSVGERIFFGSYEQDNNTSNGSEPIKWRVLAVENDRALLITEKLIDCVKYNNSDGAVTWAECDLRYWMNNTFYNSAFSSEEKQSILKTHVRNPDNSYHGTDGGADTDDYLFCLSLDEVSRYMPSDSDKAAVPTKYARSHGAYLSEDYRIDGELSGWWWLRSPGDVRNKVAAIDTYGLVRGEERISLRVTERSGCARPAFWISLY